MFKLASNLGFLRALKFSALVAAIAVFSGCRDIENYQSSRYLMTESAQKVIGLAKERSLLDPYELQQAVAAIRKYGDGLSSVSYESGEILKNLPRVSKPEVQELGKLFNVDDFGMMDVEMMRVEVILAQIVEICKTTPNSIDCRQSGKLDTLLWNAGDQFIQNYTRILEIIYTTMLSHSSQA